MRKIIFILSLPLIGLSALYFSYSKRSDCFSPTFALADPSFELANLPPPREIAPLLKQSFHFLGSGNQSYAFLSHDQTTVLKLFKFHCLVDEKKIARLKKALLIAQEHNRTHSGILYIHFPKTPLFGHDVVIQDKANRRHHLPLDSYVFVLQKKATPLKEVLTDHLIKGDIQGAIEKLSKIFSMFRDDLKHNIYDHDHNVLANTGFAGAEPIRIDFGKLDLISNIDIQAELKKIASERILPWIKRKFPEVFEEFEKKLSILYKEVKQEEAVYAVELPELNLL